MFSGKFLQIWVNAWEHSIFKETKDTVTSLAYQISSEIEFKAYGKKRKVSEAGKLIGNFLSMGANAGAAFISKGEVTNFSKWWKSSRVKDDIKESDFFLPVNS